MMHRSNYAIAAESMPPYRDGNHHDQQVHNSSTATAPTASRLDSSASASSNPHHDPHTRRSTLYTTRATEWQQRWRQIRLDMLYRLSSSQQHDIESHRTHLELTADQVRFEEKLQMRSQILKQRERRVTYEQQQRQHEIRVLDEEERRRLCKREWDAGRIQEHFTSVTNEFVLDVESRRAVDELELRESLRRTTDNMRAEQREQLEREQAEVHREQERRRVEQEQKEKAAAAQSQHADQLRRLQFRSGARG